MEIQLAPEVDIGVERAEGQVWLSGQVSLNMNEWRIPEKRLLSAG